MTSSDCILETRGLEKRFGGVVAIASVDFNLKQRELRCLIGPNGAGKSTFFKMLTAQLKPTTGQILFDGVDITRAQPHQVSRLGIGIKNQVPDVFNNLTVAENISVAARSRHGKARAAAKGKDVMERLGLTALTGRLVGELAHGQRQWVELAMVVALEPKLILLDEPAAGMTADETNKTADLIREVNKSAAIVVVEHDMQFIKQIAQTVTVFHQGRVLIEDTMDKVQGNELVREVYLGKSEDD
ncbi:ABC transporter ATP-binding protein (plasmid) [Aminobacter sp. Y103A]|uniref:ABC transporter ATP-binding protein n=1 Tax=Aminobacter sp. Y103A TaxID=1870862 RepID=UPI0025746B46|nr:ABC transporter ATP-binding protein [Aminobacter sp. SS-2016]BBD40628.1 ABC transporter ATP-binding protein [Aminobacter sp. SS-2016]